MNLSALLPKPLRQRMLTEVMTSYVLLAVLSVGLSVGVAVGVGYPLAPVLAGWGGTSALFVAGGFLISTDLIGVSNGLTERARSLAAGDFSTTFDQHRDDELGDLNDALSELKRSLGEQLDDAEAARDEAATARARAEEVAAGLRTAVDEYERTFAAAADGDLTVRLNADADERALTDLEAAANEMLDDLEAIVTAVDAEASDEPVDAASSPEAEAEASGESDDASSKGVVGRFVGWLKNLF